MKRQLLQKKKCVIRRLIVATQSFSRNQFQSQVTKDHFCMDKNSRRKVVDNVMLIRIRFSDRFSVCETNFLRTFKVKFSDGLYVIKNDRSPHYKCNNVQILFIFNPSMTSSQWRNALKRHCQQFYSSLNNRINSTMSINPDISINHNIMYDTVFFLFASYLS